MYLFFGRYRGNVSRINNRGFEDNFSNPVPPSSPIVCSVFSAKEIPPKPPSFCRFPSLFCWLPPLLLSSVLLCWRRRNFLFPSLYPFL
ncbi:hypothetical protein Hdeb2414_s0011g00372711 [Helianthus debilis subsp. tardiflorus]